MYMLIVTKPHIIIGTNESSFLKKIINKPKIAPTENPFKHSIKTRNTFDLKFIINLFALSEFQNKTLPLLL